MSRILDEPVSDTRGYRLAYERAQEEDANEESQKLRPGEHKPCPHCGGTETGKEIDVGAYNYLRIYVECDTCLATGPVVRVEGADPVDIQQGIARAYERWDERKVPVPYVRGQH